MESKRVSAWTVAVQSADKLGWDSVQLPVATCVAVAARLAELEGNDDHPENRCERCSGRNITWYADSDLWNKYAADASVLCPLCFAKAVEAAEGDTVVWRVAPGDRSDEASRLFVRLHETMERLAELESDNATLRKSLEEGVRIFESNPTVLGAADALEHFRKAHRARAATDAAGALDRVKGGA